MSGSLLTLGFALEILPGKNRARQEGDWRNRDRCRGQHFLFCKSFYKDVDKYPYESRVPLPSKLDRHNHDEVCGPQKIKMAIPSANYRKFHMRRISATAWYIAPSGDQAPFLPRSQTFLGRFLIYKSFLSDQMGSGSSKDSYRKLKVYTFRF